MSRKALTDEMDGNPAVCMMIMTSGLECWLGLVTGQSRPGSNPTVLRKTSLRNFGNSVYPASVLVARKPPQAKIFFKSGG